MFTADLELLLDYQDVTSARVRAHLQHVLRHRPERVRQHLKRCVCWYDSFLLTLNMNPASTIIHKRDGNLFIINNVQQLLPTLVWYFRHLYGDKIQYQY